jgi:hypothetical protein
MRKTLIPVGSDLALILDPAVREALGLGGHVAVDVETQGEMLIVRRADEPEPDPIGEAFRQIVDHPESIHQGSAI